MTGSTINDAVNRLL